MDRLTGNSLILVGVVIVVIGLLMSFLPKGSFPKLPGDILVQRTGFTFYFPIVSSIVVSVILSLLLWLFRR